VPARRWDALLAPLLRARRFDETLVANAERVTGVFHVSIGVEATAAALACVRTADDAIALAHRNHGHLAALGSSLEGMYREVLGRDGGPQRGRAGSLHLADPANGVPYTSAMLGAGAAIAVGLALAKLRRGAPGIAFACFGDGAMDEGILHESLALARRWSVPIVFVCECNASAPAEARVAALAAAHGVPAVAVEGRRPRAALAALRAAAEEVRAGGGPRFVAAGSEPWPGNSTFVPHPCGVLDVAGAAAAPADAFAAGDPVRDEAAQLLADGVPPAALLELDAGIRAEVERAFAAAVAAEPPPAEVAHASVWAAA
jgi:TPP-dependent pyruvate/acetoin dehydrogenase alpha subunit